MIMIVRVRVNLFSLPDPSSACWLLLVVRAA